MAVVSDRLVCRACGVATDPLGVQYCDRCFGPLDLVDLPTVDAPRTPLVAAPGVGERLGLRDLWLKDETANPTGSFKDRVVAAAADRAVAIGAPVLACSSTGNLARALAVRAAAGGPRAVVVVPRTLGEAEREALVGQGATVVVVDGDYDAANRVAAEAAEDLPDWGWVNGNLRPWYSSGAATVGVELATQGPPGLGPPDQVVLPMASGALAFQVHRALPEARLVVAQPAGCAPVADAFTRGDDEVRPVRSTTDVEVLAMGSPPDGDDVLGAARGTGGAVVAVPEDALDALVDLVAGESGLAVDRASAVALAGARRAVGDGFLDPSARTVVVLTGGSPRWPEAPVAAPGGTVTIPASSAALRDAIGEEPA